MFLSKMMSKKIDNQQKKFTKREARRSKNPAIALKKMKDVLCTRVSNSMKSLKTSNCDPRRMRSQF